MKYGCTISGFERKIIFVYEDQEEDLGTQKRILGHIFSEIGEDLKFPEPGEYKKVRVSRFGEDREMVAFEIDSIDSEVLIVKPGKSAKKVLQKWLSKIVGN